MVKIIITLIGTALFDGKRIKKILCVDLTILQNFNFNMSTLLYVQIIHTAQETQSTVEQKNAIYKLQYNKEKQWKRQY